MLTRLKILIGVIASSFFVTFSAYGHHPLGGETPETVMHGILSGIGHPILGADHLAFVVAVGVLGVLSLGRFVMPLWFILATLVGALIHLASVTLPFAELIIALSVALIGVVIFAGRVLPTILVACLFAFSGLFHGFAYGEAIFGAETGVLVAYLAGFGATQYAIALLAGFVVSPLLGVASWTNNVPARIVGGVVAGAGGLLLYDHALVLVGLTS